MGRKPTDSSYLNEDFGLTGKIREAQCEGYDYSLLDRTNPRSLISLIEYAPLEKAILALDRDLLLEPEALIKRRLKVRKQFEFADTCLRLNFWMEYARAQEAEKIMSIEKVFKGVCSEQYFQNKIITNPDALAWMIRPPTDYISFMRGGLHDSLEEVIKIVNTPFVEKVPYLNKKTGEPIKDEKGRIMYWRRYNTKIMSEKLKAAQWFDVRVNGAIVQKLAIKQESHNMNYNVSGSGNELAKYSLDELQKIGKITKKTLEIEGDVVEEDHEIGDSPADSEPEKETSD